MAALEPSGMGLSPLSGGQQCQKCFKDSLLLDVLTKVEKGAWPVVSLIPTPSLHLHSNPACSCP